MKTDKDLELKNLNAEDAAWAGFLSNAADLREVDNNASSNVLKALKLERTQNLVVADGETWANYISSGAVLRPVDYASVKPVLAAVHLERTKNRKILRLNIMRFVTASAAVAAVVIGVIVFQPQRITEADPTEAFAAYQEASQGW